MKNFESIIDEIYEFMDEILGSLIPGIYFCSYPIFVVFIFVNYFKQNNLNLIINIPYLPFIMLVLAYVLGTMFRRSNSREPDHFSAKFTYFNSVPRDDNDFSFCRLVNDSEFKKFADDLIDKINKKVINIKFKESQLRERKRKYKFYEKIIHLSYLKDKKFFRMYSKPEIQRRVYNKLLKRQQNLQNKFNKEKNLKLTIDEIINSFEGKKLENLSSEEKEILEINDFIKKYKLEEFVKIYVDYPYANLKDYLKDRNLDDLIKYVNWDFEDESKKTTRSKSLICNAKLYIKHKSPRDFGQLLKIEAHIRFMNSIWYANKYLSYITGAVAFITIIAYGILETRALRLLYKGNKLNGLKFLLQKIIGVIENIFITIFGNQFKSEDLLKPMIIIFILSVAYLMFGKLIKRTIENNYHYQRIREIVSVLFVYDLIKKEDEADKNEIDSSVSENRRAFNVHNLLKNFNKRNGK